MILVRDPYTTGEAATRRRSGCAEQRLVFADALTAPEGELLVWASPVHDERVLPALRALLDLPFERVIVSHGEPVHDRARSSERPSFGRGAVRKTRPAGRRVEVW